MSKYLTYKYSDVETDNLGNSYPDVFTFPINKFIYTRKPYDYALSIRDINRFDILMAEVYGDANFGDIVLWLNNISHIQIMNPGDYIKLPSSDDIRSFYRTYK